MPSLAQVYISKLEVKYGMKWHLLCLSRTFSKKGQPSMMWYVEFNADGKVKNSEHKKTI